MTSRNNRFTPAERKALHNKDFFYIKASATKKIDILLAGVRDEIKSEIKKKKLLFPEEADASAGKIFKGENYAGLPYMVLDFPKYFTKESVFSFRTMCWWGNFFSFTLHLQGKALEERRNLMITNGNAFRKKNIFICINSTPWNYQYNSTNYQLIDKFPEEKIKHLFSSKEFVKLSRKTGLNEYRNLPRFCRESFQLFLPAFSKQQI